MNGWTRNGAELKSLVCSYGDPDIICLLETHLGADESVCITGYRSYDQRRVTGTARRSGGVSILIKDGVFQTYLVSTVSVDYEGILGLKLTHKATLYESVIVANYLPPSNSEYGRDPESFFAKLLCLNYENYDVDLLYMCGDLNARIGGLQEVLGPGVSARGHIDSVINSHGRCLLDFLNDSMCCVLNGRLSSPCFTCHTGMGSSTVDYGIVPSDLLNKVRTFQVHNLEQIINELDCSWLDTEGSRPPDHDLVQCVVETTGHHLSDFVKGLGTLGAKNEN